MMNVLPTFFLPSGLVHHVCHLFTETVTLCLDVDNKNNTEMAGALLCSLLDILHGMLTYTSSVVRLALQVGTSVPCRDEPCTVPGFPFSPSFLISLQELRFSRERDQMSHLW